MYFVLFFFSSSAAKEENRTMRTKKCMSWLRMNERKFDIMNEIEYFGREKYGKKIMRFKLQTQFIQMHIWRIIEFHFKHFVWVNVCACVCDRKLYCHESKFHFLCLFVCLFIFFPRLFVDRSLGRLQWTLCTHLAERLTASQPITIYLYLLLCVLFIIDCWWWWWWWRRCWFLYVKLNLTIWNGHPF